MKNINTSILRYNKSLSSNIESSIIKFLLPYIPRNISSNMLTTLGLVSSLCAAILYTFASSTPEAFLLINLCLFLNWFGDSFDGRLAVFRNQQQPILGYYMDHIFDAFSVFAICLGITFSEITNSPIWIILSTIYIIFELHSALEAITIKKYSISFGLFGPTEIRIFIIILNTLAFFKYKNYLNFFAHIQINIFDTFGLLLGVLAFILLLHTVSLTIYRYYLIERKNELGK